MIAFRRRLRGIVAILGLCIGLAVAIGAPLGYLLIAYSRIAYELSLVAELNAGRVAKYIYVHRELWQFHALRLAEIIEVPEAQDVVVGQRLYDAARKQVLQTGAEPAWPAISREAVVTVAGSPAATIEIASTLRPILLTALIVAAISGMLGVAIVIAIRTIPLRVIDRSLSELAATRARYRLLFRANPFPMSVIHRETGAFLAVNRAATELYGWSQNEALTMTTAAIRAPDATGAVHRRGVTARAGFDSAATYRRQHRQRTKDGKIIEVEVYSRAIEFDGQPAFLSLGIDVTDRNRFEEQLRHSQKMEAVGQMTGGIAHDFNNLLNILVAHLEMLQDEQQDAPSKARIAKMLNVVDRATELTRNLLSFSRKQPLRLEVTNINELVVVTIDMLQRTLGAHIDITTTLAEELWLVEADRNQLQAALLNLCVNARDAMPSGGALHIETGNVSVDTNYASRHPGAAAGDYAMLTVSDTGSGMPPEIVAQVFDPFFTTKSVGKGTGLGLSMVYGFIKQSKGYVTAESELGRGSAFKLYLPRTAATSVGAAVENREGHLLGNGERILVVEDQPELRVSVVEQLQSLGYSVQQAGDGLEALAVFSGGGPAFDLLLTDVVMPRMNGRVLGETVGARWPATKIIFMSGYAEDEIVHKGIVDPHVRLLKKPFRKRELANTVRQAFEKTPA